MVTTPAAPAWHLVEAPTPDSSDHPDAWVATAISDLVRHASLADVGHDDFAPRAVDVLVGIAHQEHAHRRHVLAVSGDEPTAGHAMRVVGHGVLVLPRSDNRHLAIAQVTVAPSHRGRGIGTALAERLRELAVEDGRTTVLGEVEFAAEAEPGTPGAVGPAEGPGLVPGDLPGLRFAQRAGLRLELVERRSVLELPLPDGVIDRFVAEAATHAGDDYRLHTWQGTVPEEWVEQLAALEQSLSEDEPNGGLALEAERWDGARLRVEEAKRRERGQDVLVTAVEHVPTGTLAGMTYLQFTDDRPELTEQESTVVLAGHRGHRLGMLMKAVNLREHARVRPQARRVSTWNNETNGPMLAINVALGFRPAGGSAELQASLTEPARPDQRGSS
ncbi:GNAT family N-acetyltransferase [Isoptericola sp. NEAU-Y5]|uniref:GNAT family N-acetyltransferase n=1 Tax=Isoptericola luteus TaxID=2879484 RepID=A0ABS7ZHN1_9MICO|nr:GNAT family N-acetyltransferase [Isoptericola sp. NEAU-Y5]MCA5894433.1 GNAT family N-acetyltransferase [Isoptericola sp. NEAU-Y5]